MSRPWFRLYAEFATDPVVQSLSFDDQRHYTVLLCLKCSGVLDRDIPTANRERLILRGLGLAKEAGDEAKRRLAEMRLIDTNWQPLAWDKRQYESDSSTKRVRKYRKRKETGNVSETVSNRLCNAPDTDTEEDRRIEDRKTTSSSCVVLPLQSEQHLSTERISDEEIDPDPGDSKPGRRAPIRTGWVVDLYHEMLPELPGCEKDQALHAQIATLIREGHVANEKAWRGFFRYVKGNDFLMGKGQDKKNGKPFKASLRWITKRPNYIKISERFYDR